MTNAEADPNHPMVRLVNAIVEQTEPDWVNMMGPHHLGLEGWFTLDQLKKIVALYEAYTKEISWPP